MSKNLDETICLQSEIRQEWIREMREQRLLGIARAQVALPVWPGHQPRRFPVEMSVRGSNVA